MSQYYHGQRTRGLYDPAINGPGRGGPAFKLSRSKIELFLECPRCFYLDRRLGVGRPPGFPFSLNSAVDRLLKQEFDLHRAQNTRHPLIAQYGIDAKPVNHPQLEDWRQNFVGVQYLHPATNFLISGAIDDLWQNPQGEYIVVDYKATAKEEEITALDKDWQNGYKRQMEIYQWLLRQNGFPVSETGYFVYCNGRTDRAAFDAKLEFKITLIPHRGNTVWIDKALKAAQKCLAGQTVPSANPGCDYCRYVEGINAHSLAK